MGLNYLTLENKPNISLTDENGNKIICKDLLPKTTDGIFAEDRGSRKIIVNKYYVARPDLISLAFYGTDEYADIICKINGISNPFELNEDDMLDIPSAESIRYYSRPNSNKSELVKDGSNIGKAKKSKQKQLDKKRSPAEQVVGDKNYIIDRSMGMVFY